MRKMWRKRRTIPKMRRTMIQMMMNHASVNKMALKGEMKYLTCSNTTILMIKYLN
jgi:RNase P subunit RPR2